MDNNRYGRQVLITGAENQVRLEKMRLVVVGAGGIGCALLSYVVGGGVGRVTICDGDIVEESNLHRQPLHHKPGENKAASAAKALRKLNPLVEFVVVEHFLKRDQECLDILEKADVVADCTDNVDARYLLNDACCLTQTKLFSASALGREGSLTNYFFQGSACYRCLNPKRTFESLRRCGDRGVMGPVPGAIGALQALEILSPSHRDDFVAVFDGLELRRFKKPKQRPSCELCFQEKKLFDFFADKQSTMSFPPKEVRLTTPKELKDMIQAGKVAVVDVRDAAQFSLGSLPNAVSCPLPRLLQRPQNIDDLAASLEKEKKAVVVCCRRGVDSRLASRTLCDHPSFSSSFPDCRHLVGGLQAWKREFVDDSSFTLL